MVRKAFVAGAAFVLVIALAPEASAAVRCGSIVRESIVLTRNLLNCDSDGLNVAASGITIDLNGYRIDGQNVDGTKGIDNHRGRNRVRVINGTISEFDIGVYGDDADRNRIDSVAFGKANVAVELIHANENVIADNTIFARARDGIFIQGKDNVLVANEFIGGRPAIAIDGHENRVEDNEVLYSGAADIGPAILYDGERNRIDSNTVRGGGTGIQGGNDDNLIVANDLRDGAGDGIILRGRINDVRQNEVISYDRRGILLPDSTTDRNVLYKNDFERNGRDGALIEGDRNRLDANDFTANRDDGLEINGEYAVVRDNDAEDNGDFGILVRGDNVAGTNNDVDDNGRGCFPAGLCD